MNSVEAVAVIKAVIWGLAIVASRIARDAVSPVLEAA